MPTEAATPIDEGELSAEHIGATSVALQGDPLERRRAPRVALPQPIPVRARAQAALEVRLLDLSLTGGRIEHLGILLPGSACVLEFPAAQTPLVLSARVVRSTIVGDEPGPSSAQALRYQTGLAFVDVTSGQQAILARIVEWLALGGSAEGILTLA